ncbi:hypothetical protein RRG08_049920 [Elysia crispata]|uniref:Uncharacterized protein n=1 Tax=Elysia crispata TaxID=231223 RepID=A0AAE0XZA1_9GAST|nr:hypothetical protein RRG08_049920 [Elysia crispata]
MEIQSPLFAPMTYSPCLNVIGDILTHLSELYGTSSGYVFTCGARIACVASLSLHYDHRQLLPQDWFPDFKQEEPHTELASLG